MAAIATSSRPISFAIASKVRFFFFFASKRVGEDDGRRGIREAYFHELKSS
jgi:hypothetical protein